MAQRYSQLSSLMPNRPHSSGPLHPNSPQRPGPAPQYSQHAERVGPGDGLAGPHQEAAVLASPRQQLLGFGPGDVAMVPAGHHGGCLHPHAAGIAGPAEPCAAVGSVAPARAPGPTSCCCSARGSEWPPRLPYFGAQAPPCRGSSLACPGLSVPCTPWFSSWEPPMKCQGRCRAAEDTGHSRPTSDTSHPLRPQPQ